MTLRQAQGKLGAWEVRTVTCPCGYRWVAACPYRTPRLECPACHEMVAVRRG